MKKLIILIVMLFSISSNIFADDYKIISMNVQSIKIGKKYCKVGSIFNEQETIYWTDANEEIWVLNTTTYKPLLLSKYLFEIKKTNTVKNFYVKTNTFGTMSVGEPEWFLVQSKKDVGEVRKALVIGNSNYIRESSLRAPASDAVKVADKLASLGFDVYLMLDSKLPDIDKATKVFSDRAKGADIAMFYYIGHGQQISGETYLIPIESIVERESDRYSCMYGPQIVARLDETDANSKLIFIDACRSEGNYLMGASKQFSMEAPLNGIVMFSTKSGDYAFDGDKDESTPFTKAFCSHIDQENAQIEVVLSNIVAHVTKLTSNYIEKQIPNYNTSLTHSVYLNKVVYPDSDISAPQFDNKTDVGPESEFVLPESKMYSDKVQVNCEKAQQVNTESQVHISGNNGNRLGKAQSANKSVESYPKKRVQKLEKAKTDILVKTGFRQFVDMDGVMFEFGFNGHLDITQQITYSAGYKFNEHFFIGGGAGILLGESFDLYVAYSKFSSTDDTVHTHKDSTGALPLRMISYPIFIKACAYLLKTKVQPYVSLNTGVLVSGKMESADIFRDFSGEEVLQYNCSRFFINPIFGANFPLKTCEIQTGFSWRMSLNPICNKGKVESALCHSIGLVLGVSF